MCFECAHVVVQGLLQCWFVCGVRITILCMCLQLLAQGVHSPNVHIQEWALIVRMEECRLHLPLLDVSVGVCMCVWVGLVTLSCQPLYLVSC